MTIQGYKVGKGEHVSPVWMLKEASLQSKNQDDDDEHV